MAFFSREHRHISNDVFKIFPPEIIKRLMISGGERNLLIPSNSFNAFMYNAEKMSDMSTLYWKGLIFEANFGDVP